ncbi:MAG: hypothetical protein ABIP75_19600 [Pyrinomonadaceae bacterium]
MIRDKLVPLIRLKYGDRSIQSDEQPGPVAVFPAKHPRVGDLQIYDHGEEVTIYFSELTHGHFNPYESELKQEQIDELVANEVMEFLDDLFADRYLLWKSRTGNSDGFQLIDPSLEPIAYRPDTDYFTWSGPADPAPRK